MTDNPTATTSRRWHPPKPCDGGTYWRARTRMPLTSRELAAGLEPVVFGPDADACAREIARQDRKYAELAERES